MIDEVISDTNFGALLRDLMSLNILIALASTIMHGRSVRSFTEELAPTPHSGCFLVG